VSEPTFSQQQSRSLLVPALVAVALLAIAFFVARHFFAAPTLSAEHVRTEILPTVSVYKTDTIVVGPNETNHTLFVASTLRVGNQQAYPVSLDDFTLTLTDPSGAELVERAIQKQDLPNLEIEFPKLKPLLATPLLRDTSIDPKKSVEGTVLFSLPISQSVWDSRGTAEIKVDIYHNHPLFLTIPK